MTDIDALGRVRQFLDEIEHLPLEMINRKVQKIESEIYELFKRLERLHSLSDIYQPVDLSEDIYTLCRLLERKRIVKRYPLLSRAAGLL